MFGGLPPFYLTGKAVLASDRPKFALKPDASVVGADHSAEEEVTGASVGNLSLVGIQLILGDHRDRMSQRSRSSKTAVAATAGVRGEKPWVFSFKFGS